MLDSLLSKRCQHKAPAMPTETMLNSFLRECQNDAQAKCIPETLDADAWRIRASRVQNALQQLTQSECRKNVCVCVYVCS